MKGLRIYLVSIYVILVILLLLSQCCRCCSKSEKGELPPVKESFKADVVMCIDATGSMAGIIGTVKDNALNFYSDLTKESRRQGKEITAMRLKVIAFRDYDPVESFTVFDESDFYTLPDQESQFSSFVHHLEPQGGADEPELGVDALARAVKSLQSSDSDSRKVIILWTDASTKPIAFPKGHGFVNSSEVAKAWNSKIGGQGRIFIFAPPHISWTNLSSELNNTVIHDVEAGRGLSDVDYEEILRAISEDI